MTSVAKSLLGLWSGEIIIQQYLKTLKLNFSKSTNKSSNTYSHSSNTIIAPVILHSYVGFHVSLENTNVSVLLSDIFIKIIIILLMRRFKDTEKKHRSNKHIIIQVVISPHPTHPSRGQMPNGCN